MTCRLSETSQIRAVTDHEENGGKALKWPYSCLSLGLTDGKNCDILFVACVVFNL